VSVHVRLSLYATLTLDIDLKLVGFEIKKNQKKVSLQLSNLHSETGIKIEYLILIMWLVSVGYL